MQILLAVTTTSTNDLPIWAAFAIVGGFLSGFPLIWCLVVFILSRVGDWHRLAAAYAAGDRQPSGTVHKRLFGMVGIARYKFMLTLHRANDGFFLEVPALFRIGHPRLFIPWNAISERGTKRFFRWETTTLSIGRPRIGTIALGLSADQLQAP